MRQNMGTIDRVLRVVVATVIPYLYFTNVLTGAVGITLLVFGAVFLLTSVISFCPLYLPFGINTKGDKK